jgi:hypothetical protein
MNKKITFVVLGVLLISCACFFSFNNNIKSNYEPTEDTNYVGLVKLGLAPSTYPRQPQEKDIDTGIKLRDGDNIYSLIESRTWGTKDYGKTFLVRVA